ncbi:MFS transporter, putative metabolite:H+ symporter [Streptomyces sp. cf386]|uniref:MFS transporter n=1 Tax=Streptomyces sp. cf386 TaxID=1761904 RepID=UPI000883BC9D|nr:MFS transporter [Streptomyces sp. cf386]SDO82381.1 MFS transporter, putative metabolite:H+ symporter [Streptomyces sp. cf386]
MTIDAHRAATDRPGDAPPLAADIGARFERLPLCRWQVMVRLIIGTATFFEAFDQLLIAYALPQLRTEWSLGTGHTTALMTVGSIGMLVGALVSGRLADRIGRVKVIAACIALASLCNLALTLCTSPEPFMAIRFVQGMAIGGEVPIAATFIAEITRAHQRGRFVLLFELVFPAGLTAGALVAYWLVPLLGWRWMFGLAALPAVLCLVILRYVPESPRWLAGHGQNEKALATMASIEAKVEKITGTPLPDPQPAPSAAPPQGKGGLGELLSGRYRKRMIVVGLLWFTGYFVNYGITSWLPTIYGTRFHLDLSTALLYSTVTSGAGLLGCLIVALTVDRAGRRNTVIWCLSAAAVCLLVLGLSATGTAVGVLAWTSLAAVFLFGCNICLYVYTPELFPTRIRALGVSLGGAMNRLGIILGPIVVGAVYAGGAIGTVFVTLAAVALVGSLTARVGAEETSGRSLEDAAP